MFDETVNSLNNKLFSLEEARKLFNKNCLPEQDPISNPLLENVMISPRDMWGNLWQFRKN
jgi:hypothetical protein